MVPPDRLPGSHGVAQKHTGGFASASEFDRTLTGALFRELSFVAGDVVLLVGGRGEHLVGANPQITKSLGYSKKSLRLFGISRIFADRTAVRDFFRAVWNGAPNLSIRIDCIHACGRRIPASVRSRLLPESGNQLAVVVIRLLSSEPLPSRFDQRAVLSRLLRIATAPGFLSALNLQSYVQSWLRQICRVAQFPVGHVQILREDAAAPFHLARALHVAPSKELRTIRRDPADFDLPPEFLWRVAAAREPLTVSDLLSDPHFQSEEVRRLNLRSAIAVPIAVGEEIVAVSIFFSSYPVAQDSPLVDVAHALARELGHAIHFRSLSLKLARLQDDERRRLASELHDTVAQSLSVLLLDLDTVQQEAPSLTAAAGAALARAVDMATQSLQEIRTLSYLLHPPVLEALGLVPALRVLIQGFSRRSGIRIFSELPDTLPRMPTDWEVALFRVVQEGLTNVQRYSKNPSAEISMSLSAGTVTLQVINEGSSVPSLESGGISPEKSGVGIAGMRERVRALGGEVNLFSSRDKTILEACVPIPKNSRSPQLPLKF
ncbi:MAG: GAF domain-containing sensor histidine kinase [Candidatus Acidiferrales bacterium]